VTTGTVAVLDTAVLMPPGLRDPLLSVAEAGGFRPLWQDQIEGEAPERHPPSTASLCDARGRRGDG
jgi:hypothetical protein